MDRSFAILNKLPHCYLPRIDPKPFEYFVAGHADHPCNQGRSVAVCGELTHMLSLDFPIQISASLHVNIGFYALCSRWQNPGNWMGIGSAPKHKYQYLPKIITT